MEEEIVGQDKISGDVQDSSDVAIGKDIEQAHIETGGGAHVASNVSTGRDFIGRDQITNNFFGTSAPPGSSRSPQLSKEAIDLLKEAAQDDAGSILLLDYLNGPLLRTNNVDFISGSNPREVATWKAALDELVSANLVEVAYQSERSVTLELTKHGYDIADQFLRPA